MGYIFIHEREAVYFSTLEKARESAKRIIDKSKWRKDVDIYKFHENYTGRASNPKRKGAKRKSIKRKNRK